MPNYKLCYHWTPPPVVYTCDECADCYQISISGLSDAICDDCDNWHGTHILERIGDCNWEWVNSDLGKTICGNTAYQQMHMIVQLLNIYQDIVWEVAV